MKIKPEHLDAMESAILTICPDKRAKHLAFLKAEGKAKDVQKRLRWDLLNATLGSSWICRTLYPYASDAHIDTALRAVMKKIETN